MGNCVDDVDIGCVGFLVGGCVGGWVGGWVDDCLVVADAVVKLSSKYSGKPKTSLSRVLARVGRVFLPTRT